MEAQIRCSPTETDPTHHLVLRDRTGRRVGLILVDAQGRIVPKIKAIPVERTALKTTTGGSSYDSMDFPYSPIVQDDWSGGRGNLDFERDSTRYDDAYRARTSRPNKMLLGPQEQYVEGYRSLEQQTPGNVTWHTLTGEARVVAKRFQADATFTAALDWLLVRRRGSPADLTIAIYSDNAGAINALISSITVASTRLPDVISEWLAETANHSLTLNTYYWMTVIGNVADDNDKHWEIAVKASTGTTYVGPTAGGAGWAAATFDLYFRLTDANDLNETCRMVEYRGMQYFFFSGLTGAPKIYMNGDRGAADSNAGQLTKLIDGIKSWPIDKWAGSVVVIVGGPGSNEPQPYRIIASNTATDLVVTMPWLTEHTGETEYVIVGNQYMTEITGHGLTAPVTDVLVSIKDVLYVCQGDAVDIMALRNYNDGGTFRDFGDAANCQNTQAGFKATYITHLPQNDRIVIARNTTATGVRVVECQVGNAATPAFASDLTFAAAVQIGNLADRIQGLEVYPDINGDEAVRVYKQERPWYLPPSGTPYPLNLREMRTMRSEKNGVAHLIHNVYEFFSLGNGITRYYGVNFDDVGPNLGEGLPADRRGPTVALVGLPGKFLEFKDAGPTGYSSINMRDGNGWHEHYRAPKGQRITAAAFQVVPGTKANRLWFYQGNDLIWLPFPSEDGNELADSEYRYTHEMAVILSRMHSGMFDVQKMLKIIKIQSENLAKDTCWVELDYRLAGETAWTTMNHIINTSPTQQIDLTSQYGLASKRLQFRIRAYTADATKTPIILALIAEAVLRVSVKEILPIMFRVMDAEPSLQGDRDPDPYTVGKDKLDLLKYFASDECDSMLKTECVHWLWHDRTVFLNPISTEVLTVRPEESDHREPYDIVLCTASLQEA